MRVQAAVGIVPAFVGIQHVHPLIHVIWGRTDTQREQHSDKHTPDRRKASERAYEAGASGLEGRTEETVYRHHCTMNGSGSRNETNDEMQTNPITYCANMALSSGMIGEKIRQKSRNAVVCQ